MPGPFYPRVFATSTTTGTGTYTLGSTVTGYQGVPAALDGKTVYYSAFEVDANGVPLPNHFPDPHYTLVPQPASHSRPAVVLPLRTVTFANSPASPTPAIST